MPRPWRAPATGALALALAAGHAQAQVGATVSVQPLVGYLRATNEWTNSGDITLEPGAGIFVGVKAEVSVGKLLGLSAEITRTLGLTQTMTFSASNFFPGQLETDMTTTQVAGTVLLRPLGRLPSGAPRSVYFEVGAGFTLYDVGEGFQPPGGGTSRFDFGASSPMVMAGVGLSIPAGPRFNLQVYGRAQYHLSAYESDGLDNWNSLPPPTSVTGEKLLLLQFGVGLRVGR
jgi:hypothetical protein